MTITFFLINIFLAIGLTRGFPNGAPNYVCKSLFPSHNYEPKKDNPPYKMTLSRSAVMPGGSTSVLLQKTGQLPFLGFICAGSVSADQSNVTAGAFSLTTASNNLAQLLQCSSAAPNTAVTHINRDAKDSIGFDWAVPVNAAIGSVYKIRCTFVLSFDDCWTNILQEVTVVGKDESNATNGSAPVPVSIQSASTTTMTPGSSTSTVSTAKTPAQTTLGRSAINVTQPTTEVTTPTTTQACCQMTKRLSVKSASVNSNNISMKMSPSMSFSIFCIVFLMKLNKLLK